MAALRYAPGLRRPLTIALGAFGLRWEPRRGGRIVIVGPGGRALWASRRGRAFLAAGFGRARIRESRGHVTIGDRRRARYERQDLAEIAPEGEGALIRGRLRGRAGELAYRLRLRPLDARQLGFSLELIEPSPPRPPSRARGRGGSDPANRVALILAAGRGERFVGGGVQYTYPELSGRRLPLVIGEQGIGRGLQPLTFLANLRAGAGGSWHSSYAAAPHLIGSAMRGLCLESTEPAFIDLRRPGELRVELLAGRMAGRMYAGDTPAALIAAHTSYAGRARPMPDWLHDGAIIGLQGGTARVRALLDRILAAGAPVSAVWLQDWVGPRQTSFGRQLWWNWELDRDHYPGWEDLRADLRRRGIRLLTYVNPFVADARDRPGRRRNLFAEGAAGGHLLKDAAGQVIMCRISDFSAGLVDLTSPSARAWYAAALAEALRETGADGWMADFGEGMPFEAMPASGEPALALHNRYPELWAGLSRLALNYDGRGGERTFFMRAGYTRSPGLADMFWAGDQLPTWDAHDGMRSAIIGMLSGGLSGFSISHSDIGGYTGVGAPLFIRRDRELLLRWLELGALSAVFRTHEGNRPAEFAQVYDDAELLAQLARCARIYAAWGFYRRALAAEAARTGLPIARHPLIHYPDDPAVWRIRHECYLLGTELLAAPVTTPGAAHVAAYLPGGPWVHLWTGATHGRGWAEVAAPIGTPALFHRPGSAVGARLAAALRHVS